MDNTFDKQLSKYKRIDDAIRKQIAALYEQGVRVEDIAENVGLHYVSVYREIGRGITDRIDRNGRFEYDIEKARMSAAIARANRGKYKGAGIDGRSKRRQK